MHIFHILAFLYRCFPINIFFLLSSVYSTCKMPQLRHKNASIEGRKNVLHASQPGTLFTQAYKELTMGIPSVLTTIERHTLNQSNLKQ